MKINAFQIFHKILLKEGFIRKGGGRLHCYQANLPIKGKVFGIEICFDSDDFIELPTIRVISWPDNIPSFQPHVESNGKLCYLDHEYIYLDRYDPYSSLHIILESAKKLLSTYVKQDNDYLENEFSDEFTSYWGGEALVFVRAWEKNSTISLFERTPLSINSSPRIEGIIYKTQKQLSHWLNKRNAINANETIPLAEVVIVKLKKACIIPIHSNWPPNSTKELLTWMTEIDHGATQSLTHKMGKTLAKKKSLFIIITSTSGHVGIYVKYHKFVTERFKRNTNNLLKRRKGIKLQSPYNILSSKFAAKDEIFTKYFVVDASDERISSRNQSDKFSLIGKRIAIIGCGTVGGYAAQLLNQIGAGIKSKIGKGCLDLFDNDLLEIDNLGRHILSSSYVMDNKAQAIAHYLQTHSYSENLNINGYDEKINPKAIKKLKGYDIVIDLTGNEEFSTALNHYNHKQERELHVIYAWIVLGGKGVRALLDDFTGACYRCLRLEKNGVLGERFGLLPSSAIPPQPITRQCGSSYFPYASGASAACATLVQQMVIDYFSGSSSPRFRHLSLSTDILSAKHGNPKRYKKCQCCSI